MSGHSDANNNVTTLLGMPMRWELRNIFKNYWNREEERIFPPKYFGIGWDLNVFALAKRLGLVDKRDKGA